MEPKADQASTLGNGKRISMNMHEGPCHLLPMCVELGQSGTGAQLKPPCRLEQNSNSHSALQIMKCICHKLSAPSAILFSSSSWPDRFCGLNPEPMKAPTSGTRSTPAQWEEHFEGILIRAEGLERRKLVAHFEFGCSFHAKHVVDVVEIEGCK